MAWHISFFLKSLSSLEEFRNNPHVKIPPKSPCANFQSLGIFKNKILFGKEFSPSLSAHSAFRPSRGPFSFFFQPTNFPSPPHRASASRLAQPTIMAQAAIVFFLPASCRLHGRPDASTGREKRPHLIPLHFPSLIGTIPPSSILETDTFNPAIEAPSSWQLKALGPPPPRLRPIKADPALGEASHTPNAPSLSPCRRPFEPKLSPPVRRSSTAS
jgi:hypothetical protein